MPSRAIRRGLSPGDVAAGKADAAAIGPDLAAQHVEARGLAGAVGTDEGHELALGEREADAGHRLDAAIGLGEAVHGEQAHAGLSLPRRQRATKPAMPSGKASTRAMMTRPITSRQRSV